MNDICKKGKAADQNDILRRLLTTTHNPRDPLDEDAIIEEVRKNPASVAKSYLFQKLYYYPLHQAILRNASLNVLEAIYNAFPQAIKEKTASGDTALHLTFNHHSSLHIYSSNYTSLEVIEFLLSKWPEATQVKDPHGNTPLHLACSAWTPALEVVRLLVNNWPNALKEKNNDGETPFYRVSSMSTSMEKLSYILNSWPGAIKEKDNCGYTPLHATCVSYKPPVEKINLILNSWPGALKEKDSGGSTPLHCAVYHGVPDTPPPLKIIFRLLEEYPEATREVDEEGNTPLDIFNDYSYETPNVAKTVVSLVSKLCDNEFDITSSKEMITYFVEEVKWYKGVTLILDRHPSAYKDLNIGNEVLPDFLSLLGRRCNLTTMWHVVSNKQDILADL